MQAADRAVEPGRYSNRSKTLTRLRSRNSMTVLSYSIAVMAHWLNHFDQHCRFVDYLGGEPPAREHLLGNGASEVAGVLKVCLLKRCVCLVFRDVPLLHSPNRVKEKTLLSSRSSLNLRKLA